MHASDRTQSGSAERMFGVESYVRKTICMPQTPIQVSVLLYSERPVDKLCMRAPERSDVGDGVLDVPKYAYDCAIFKIILLNNCPMPIQSPSTIATKKLF